MKKLLVFLAILASMGFTAAPPQTGNLIVSVISEEGQILPGASVTISSNVLMGTRTQTTGASGKATFRDLPPGEYTIEVTMDGFQPVKQNGIKIEAFKTAKFDVSMKMGQPKEIVEVVGTGPIVDTTNCTVSTDSSNLSVHTPSTRHYASIAGSAVQAQNSFRNPFPSNFNTEEYTTINENTFLESTQNPLSTFSIDVDTASYSNIRRFLENGSLPPIDAVRIEEMINYFDYDYPQPEDDSPFSITTEISKCPWNSDHQLALIGFKGKEISRENRQPSNLVFLIDVSGSMQDTNKLPLVRRAFKMLVQNLEPKDTVAIVIYASSEGLALPATSAYEKKKIIAAIDSLEAGGCTAGEAGIQLAYKIAEENFQRKGNNRVILATDGDFNVGISNTSDLVRMIEEKRKKGIYLTILGFGMGNYKDSRMEELADKGNGNYYYIDNIMEGKKVLVDDLTSTIFAIAKDVKIQVEFNPAKIKAYRLIGYENRMLRKEDFKDDTKDAGELGAGHTVTALYELIPMGIDIKLPDIPDLKYQITLINKDSAFSNEIMTVKLRYKPIGSEKSVEIVRPVSLKNKRSCIASENLRFAAAVAEFGMLLRNSEYAENIDYKDIYENAKSAKGIDAYEYRSEFLKLVNTAKELDVKRR